jgi:hypothetical protein
MCADRYESELVLTNVVMVLSPAETPTASISDSDEECVLHSYLVSGS